MKIISDPDPDPDPDKLRQQQIPRTGVMTFAYFAVNSSFFTAKSAKRKPQRAQRGIQYPEEQAMPSSAKTKVSELLEFTTSVVRNF